MNRAAVTISRVGVSRAVYRTTAASASGSYTFTGAPGATYTLTVTTADLAGRTSNVIHRTVAVPIDARQFRLDGPWHRINWRSDVAGAHIASATRGASASISATGHTYTLQVAQCRSCGYLAVYLGHQRIATLNLYAAHTRHTPFVIYGTHTTPVATRRFTFRCVGRHPSASSGSAVHLDALYVS